MQSAGQPNTALDLTRQSGPKIVTILRARFGPIAMPLYRGGAAQCQAVEPRAWPVQHQYLFARGLIRSSVLYFSHGC